LFIIPARTAFSARTNLFFIFLFFKKASLKAGTIVSVVIQMPVTDRSATVSTRQLQKLFHVMQICHD
jgi:hypothetical protein